MEKSGGKISETERVADSKPEEASTSAVDLLAVASHEIRTPLGAVLTTAEALLQSDLDPQQTKYATTLRDAADALLALSNRLLDATAASGFADAEEFRPAELVGSVAALYEVQAESKGLNLEVGSEIPQDCVVVGHPDPVRQVLTNLVDNALKYTNAGQIRLTVSMRHDGALETPRPRIEIRVSDSGVGIKDTDRDLIFDPYARLEPSLDADDEARSARVLGHGLGLWIAKRTANKLGADLFVESSSTSGTIFCFSVPLDLPTAGTPGLDISGGESLEGVSDQEDAGDAVTGLNCTVLVVDDNQSALALAEVVMSAFGWTLTTASSGAQALDIIQSSDKKFDCVLTDLAMPGMNGIDLARALKAIDPNLPILAISADPPARYPWRYDDLCLDGHIPKPYTPDGLYHHIAQAIKSSAERQNCA